MATARFIVSGKVQGVFYRASTRETAVGLGLSGSAKNLLNGDVDVLAIGESTALDALEQWLRQGPPMAVVVSVVREALADTDVSAGSLSGFTIR
jgi:acylphosphatase